MDRMQLRETLMQLVRKAGVAIMTVYAQDFGVETKADDSPLTEADMSSHRVLVAGLEALSPALPIISEESGLVDFATRQRWPRYWLIDPLDGTKEFIAKNGEFTVNVALMENGRPTLGCVGVPAQDMLYVGDVERGVAERIDADGAHAIKARAMRSGRPVAAVASRRHGGERLELLLKALETSLGAIELKNVGSALKLCLVAQGDADLYPRLGPTSEWDIAAAEAVLVAAGGAVTTFDGAPLQYNKLDILNPEFLAVADPTYDWPNKLPRV